MFYKSTLWKIHFGNQNLKPIGHGMGWDRLAGTGSYDSYIYIVMIAIMVAMIASKLGRCDSYLRNLKLSLTEPLKSQLTREKVTLSNQSQWMPELVTTCPKSCF